MQPRAARWDYAQIPGLAPPEHRQQEQPQRRRIQRVLSGAALVHRLFGQGRSPSRGRGSIELLLAFLDAMAEARSGSADWRMTSAV